MTSSICNVIYVDRRVREDRIVLSNPADVNSAAADWESPSLQENVSLLSGVFGDVHLCTSGTSCISKLFSLQDVSMMDLKPTIVLIDTPNDEPRSEESSPSRSPSPHSSPQREEEVQVFPEEDAYGLQLLSRIVSEAHLRNVSKLVVPIPIISASTADANGDGSSNASRAQVSIDRRLLKKCLDLGARDVMAHPMHAKGVTALEVHAYRAHKDAARDQQALLELRRGRKRSWVGISDDRPYAYLREAMVSNLMKRICQMEEERDETAADNVRISVSPERKSRIAAAVGKWHFSAHDFSDDELVMAASLMFKHAFAVDELEKWRIPADQLTCFLIACRAAYNTFVPYHNFRHVVDVLQATFHFLLRIGALPSYPAENGEAAAPLASKSPMASLVKPFEALVLLITAIGHDVGHPGVNNGFLVVLNSPLAQLYNDRSVLESFHCAAYSQILRRYWPSAFDDTAMRSLMISSILATDMGLHFDYMNKLKNTQDRLHASNTTNGWDDRVVEEQRALACALLIKCADISNVARRHDTALQWMHVLSNEFSRQADMEDQLNITSSLMAKPKKDMLSLAKAQLGFMDLFAIPLFKGVADIMPTMNYTVEELATNRGLFVQTIEDETAKATASDPEHGLRGGGNFSPRPVEKGSESGKGIKGAGEQDLSPPSTSPTDKPVQIPAVNDEYKEMNGTVSPFDTVADFAASDPFHVNSEGRQFASNKQRCSEATDGSASAPGGGDWASQATSATTGRMPLSPSTQGTSIISRDSMERPTSVPVTNITAPDSSKSQSAPRFESQSPPEALQPQQSPEDESSLSSNGKNAEAKPVKKKSSRFLNIFRRNKASSPPMPTTELRPDDATLRQSRHFP